MVQANPGNVMSLNPDTFTEGGGIPSQQNLLVKEARFVYHDYDGKAPKTVAVRFVLVADDGSVHTQYWSVGDPQRWQPSTDGRTVMGLGTAKNANKGSNSGILFTHLVNAGFPKEKLNPGDISVLDGLYAYFDTVAAPKRPGITNQRENAVILVPTKVLRMPGQQAAPTFQAPIAPPMPTPPAPTAPSANGTVDYQGMAVALLQTVAITKGGTFSLQDLGTAAFQNHGKESYRDQLVSYIMTAFPQQLGGLGFQFDARTYAITRKS